MFISRKKLKNIMDRLEDLEKGARVKTYTMGTVELKDLAKIVECMKQK